MAKVFSNIRKSLAKNKSKWKEDSEWKLKDERPHSAADLEDSICSSGTVRKPWLYRCFPAAIAEADLTCKGAQAAMPAITPACIERCQKRPFQSLPCRGLPLSTAKCSEGLGDWERISQRQNDATHRMDFLLRGMDSHPSWIPSLRGHSWGAPPPIFQGQTKQCIHWHLDLLQR